MSKHLHHKYHFLYNKAKKLLDNNIRRLKLKTRKLNTITERKWVFGLGMPIILFSVSYDKCKCYNSHCVLWSWAFYKFNFPHAEERRTYILHLISKSGIEKRMKSQRKLAPFFNWAVCVCTYTLYTYICNAWFRSERRVESNKQRV